MTKIIDITKRVYSGGTPNTRINEYWNGDIKWLSSGETRNNFVYDTDKKITEIGVSNSSTKLAYKNSIVMACAGQGFTRGQTSYLMDDMYINQSVICIEPDEEKVDGLYLYYYLKNSYQMLRKLSDDHSSRGSITTAMIKNLEVDFPNIVNQRKISTILYSLDKKIELNNKLNNNLQELAKSIYYEKFKDKSNNGKLKDILDLYRKNVKNKDLSLKYFPVDVLPMNYLITQKGKPNEEAQSSLVEFKKYDILVGAMRVYFHRVCLAAEDGITRTTTFVLRPKNNDYLYYSLITLDKDDFIKYANDGSKGSTMPYAVWDNNCNEYEIYIPSTTEAKEFNELVKPLFEIQIINEKNNRDLEQLRSILLPKLINGEIDVENIEI